MKTPPKSTALLFGLAACLPLIPALVTSALGQAPAPSSRPRTGIVQTSMLLIAPPNPALLAAGLKSREAVARGEAAMKAGDLESAEGAFHEALSYEPDNGLAYRRLAEAYVADGRLPEASRAFHKFLEEGFGPGNNGGVGDTADEWAEYAVVLVKTGQPAEAIRCYNHAAALLDYKDSDSNGGKPTLKVLLPELVAAHPLAAQVQYTPERLQALAETAIAHEESSFGSDKVAVAHMREAIKLYPDSPVTHYYLGEALPMADSAEAKAAYAKAAQIGDERTRAATSERLKQLK